jgi:peptidoglycan/LPS O-acetylase OafA/YrhL
MFFVISGYLITSNAQRRSGNLATLSPRMFYTLRFARIAPPLLLLLAVVNLAAIAGVPIFESRTETGAPFPMWIVNLASLTFWMNVLIAHAGWINYPLGVLWSLSVEETFYATFPLICLLLRREKHLVLFWLVLIVMAPLYRLTHQGDEAQCLYAYAACSDAIAIGCITALIVRDGRLQILQTAWIQAATIAAMATLYAAASIADTNVLGVTAMALGTAICVIGAQSRHRPGPIGTWFGRLSYEHYLFHLIVLGALRTYFPPASTGGNEKLLIGAAYLLGTCALSASLSRLVTEPANRMLRGSTL